jgi:hypothetical protein
VHVIEPLLFSKSSLNRSPRLRLLISHTSIPVHTLNMCWRPAECLVSEYRTNLSPMGQLYLKSDRAGKPHSPALLLHHPPSLPRVVNRSRGRIRTGHRGNYCIVVFVTGVVLFLSGLGDLGVVVCDSSRSVGHVVLSADRKYRPVHTSFS